MRQNRGAAERKLNWWRPARIAVRARNVSEYSLLHPDARAASVKARLTLMARYVRPERSRTGHERRRILNNVMHSLSSAGKDVAHP